MRDFGDDSWISLPGISTQQFSDAWPQVLIIRFYDNLFLLTVTNDR